ncbi:MAG TPA: GntR family transcriptional regulator [Tianweitania sediminis]|nr:GntR family transcriptional regulator [Tianweitania sediminis]
MRRGSIPCGQNPSGSVFMSGPKEIPPEGVSRGATLTEQVYVQLRNGLLRGDWKPGDKISARSLSRSLGVSLTPSREAIAYLANEGAIHVSDTRMYSIPELDWQQYEEITRIRIQLEPMATQMAVEAAASDFVEQLEQINEDLKQRIKAEDFDAGLRLDSDFHLTIYDAAGSAVLRRLIDTLWLQIGPTRTRLSHEYRRRLVGYENHRAVIAAFKKNDASAAAEAMRRDLRQGADAIITVLKNTPPQSD